MSSPPRFLQNGIPYHIYNRGNRKDRIFLTYKDYQRFLRRIKEYKEEMDIQLLCYCLMPNHFHLVLIQNDEEEGITKFVHRLCTGYSKYFNIKYDLVGRLLQQRFQAKIVETDEYLLHLSRYIHLNPISDALEDLMFSSSSTPGVEFTAIQQKLRDYPWSSYNEYRTQQPDLCDKNLLLNYFSNTNSKLSYEAFVEGGIPESECDRVIDFL